MVPVLPMDPPGPASKGWESWPDAVELGGAGLAAGDPSPVPR